MKRSSLKIVSEIRRFFIIISVGNWHWMSVTLCHTSYLLKITNFQSWTWCKICYIVIAIYDQGVGYYHIEPNFSNFQQLIFIHYRSTSTHPKLSWNGRETWRVIFTCRLRQPCDKWCPTQRNQRVDGDPQDDFKSSFSVRSLHNGDRFVIITYVTCIHKYEHIFNMNAFIYFQ